MRQCTEQWVEYDYPSLYLFLNFSIALSLPLFLSLCVYLTPALSLVLGFGTTKRQIREKLKEKGYDATLQHERKIAILLYFNNALRYVIPTRNCSHRSCPRLSALPSPTHPSSFTPFSSASSSWCLSQLFSLPSRNSQCRL